MALDIPQPMFDPRLLEQYRALMEPPPEARKQAGMDSLLALGLGLLANRSPYLGQAVGNAGFAAMGTYRDRMDSARQNRMGELTGAMGLRKLQKDMELEQALNTQSEAYINSLPAEKQPAARLAFKANPTEFGKMLTGQFGPQKYGAPTQVATFQGPRLAFPSEAGEFKVTDQIPFREAPAPKGEYKYDQTSNSWLFDPVAYSRDIERARAGASNVSNINIGERKVAEGLGSQVGPIVKGTYDQALGATKLYDASERIIKAAETGNLFAGPLANIRLKAAQAADAFGVAGKDTLEKIKNTREVVRGMAEQGVAARSFLGGQAQISNTEQALLEKATSGDIGDLTVGEVSQIARITKRLAVQVHEQHQKNLRLMQGKPELSGMAEFYSVPPLPNESETERGRLRFQQYLDKGR